MTANQTAAKNVTTRYCNCGCGAATSSSKTLYKPGHDARHASLVARDDAASVQEGYERQFSYEDLPTEALRRKARAMAERLVAQASKKAQAKASKPATKKATDRAERRATAILVAQEEDRHAAEEAAKRAEIEAELAAADPSYYYEESEVKVGRWSYPARTYKDGKVTRNTKRDGSGEWIAYEG